MNNDLYNDELKEKRFQKDLERINILDKTMKILSLSKSKLYDISYIAECYEVNIKEIKNIINKDELNKRDIIGLSMELFDSKVAQEVRSRMLNIVYDSE